jgi:hypothetical protein
MISLPNGFSAIAVSLKCCIPNGIPIIVMHKSNPKMAWVKAIQMPPQRSQRTFIKMYRHPDALEWTRVSRPKGQIARAPILRVCIPKGMPAIVIISTILPIKYSMAIINPPKISQIRFPIIFTGIIIIRVLQFYLLDT